jgi:hypothetical protein
MFREPASANAGWVSVLGDFLDLMSNFDPISPAVTLIQDALNGPSVDFAVSAYAGWTKGKIRRLLSENGVKSWGFNLSDTVLTFTVRTSQAKWAYYLLDREGVPIISAPAEALDAPEKGGRKRKQTRGGSLLDQVFDFLDRLG